MSDSSRFDVGFEPAKWRGTGRRLTSRKGEFGARHRPERGRRPERERSYPAFGSAPAIRSNASRYLLAVCSMIAAGSAGAGGVLSQSRVSR